MMFDSLSLLLLVSLVLELRQIKNGQGVKSHWLNAHDAIKWHRFNSP